MKEKDEKKKDEIRVLLQMESDGTIPPDVQAEEEITETVWIKWFNVVSLWLRYKFIIKYAF